MSHLNDRVLAALGALEAVLEANEQRSAAMRRRIGHVRSRRAAGASYREIVTDEQSPLIVELLTASAQGLDQAGAEVRRSQARELHHEGMTMDQIARLYGVTRQRISTLLRHPATRA